MQCSVCNEPNDDDASYCEGCGTPLTDAAKHSTGDTAFGGAAKAVDPLIECPGCHAGPGCIDAEGHCTNCGTKRKMAACVTDFSSALPVTFGLSFMARSNSAIASAV